MASEKTDELYRALTEKGYPKELCAEIAYKYLNTDYTATRMLGYLYRMSEPPAVEVVVDEMIAILSDRDQLIKKKESEHAQAVISEMYRDGLQIYNQIPFIHNKKSADPDNAVQDLHSFVLYSYLIGIYNVRSSILTPKDDNLAVVTLI